jgi:hypothetical protein
MFDEPVIQTKHGGAEFTALGEIGNYRTQRQP